MIVASAILDIAGAQRDGRFWVTEQQTYDDGRVELYSYLCAAKADPQAIMAQRAAELSQVVKPVADPVLAKFDEAQRAYLAGDRSAAEASLADTKTLMDAKLQAGAGK